MITADRDPRLFQERKDAAFYAERCAGDHIAKVDRKNLQRFVAGEIRTLIIPFTQIDVLEVE